MVFSEAEKSGARLVHEGISPEKQTHFCELGSGEGGRTTEGKSDWLEKEGTTDRLSKGRNDCVKMEGTTGLRRKERPIH